MIDRNLLQKISCLKKISDKFEVKNKYILNSERTIKDDDFYLVLMKKWNSASPKYPLNRTKRFKNYFKYDYSIGGGFFLVIGGYGLIIDPGYNFLEIFYENGFVLRDINGIFISHCHDDHCIDLESIFSIFSKINPDLNDEDKLKIDLYINSTTRNKYKKMLKTDNLILKKKIKLIDKNNSFLIDCNEPSKKFILKTLKTEHKEIPWNNKSSKGRGFLIEYNGKRILYSGDTQFSKELDLLDQEFCDLYLLNLGNIGEINPNLNKKHLCLKGIIDIIHDFAKKNHTLQKMTIIITEVGFELIDLRLRIIKLIKDSLKKQFRGRFPIDIIISEPGTVIDLRSNILISRLSINLNDIENFNKLKKEIKECIISSLNCEPKKDAVFHLKDNQCLDIVTKGNSNIIAKNQVFIPKKQFFYKSTNNGKKIEKIIYTKINKINDIDAIRYGERDKNDLIKILQKNYIFTKDTYLTLFEYENFKS